jgi:hypothetical protein
MRNSHPIVVPALILIAVVTLVHVANFAAAPDVLSVEAGATPGGAVPAPSHDPQRVGFLPRPTVAITKTAETIPTLDRDATPRHDPDRFGAMPSFTLTLATLRTEPAASPAPTFVDADIALYAKDKARLRAAPSIAAAVLTTLSADAPLRATARSTDRAWWRVSLADGRSAYVHRSAVTKHPIVKAKLPAAPSVPVITAAAPLPAPAQDSEGLLGYVDETITWFADTAAQGSLPPAIRTER